MNIDPQHDRPRRVAFARDLPIEHLVAAPLLAAARSNRGLAEVNLDYVERLAYVDPADPSKGPRLLRFTVERPYHNPVAGRSGRERLTVAVPLLALVQLPALLVEEVAVEFDVTLHRVETPGAEPDGGQPPPGSSRSSTPRLHGALGVSPSRARSSDYRANYSFKVRAGQQAPTEGMSRLIDLMATAVAPSSQEGSEP